MRYMAASILWCAFAFAQAPEAKPDDKCSIEGTVINSATGEPVKKARVSLALAGEYKDAYAATTDASGHFLIDEIDAGRFSLIACTMDSFNPNQLVESPSPTLWSRLKRARR
jgi:hypothetical protein